MEVEPNWSTLEFPAGIPTWILVLLRGWRPLSPTQVVKLLSTELPLEVTVPLINNEGFWKATCQAKLNGYDVTIHGNNHKRCFLETIAAKAIEQYVDEWEEVEDHQGSKLIQNRSEMDCKKIIKLCRDYVQALNIHQVQRVAIEDDSFSLASDEQPVQQDIKEVQEYRVVDFTSHIAAFPNLRSIQLRCLQDCGIDFCWERLDFPEADCANLGTTFSKLQRLTYIKLYESRIDDPRLEAFLEPLLGHSSLQTLDLSRNKIGQNGALALGKLLRKNLKLTKLNLEQNKIGPEGAKHLAAVLPYCNLHSLNVSLNDIKDSGAQFFFMALRKGSRITSLSLAANGCSHKLGNFVSELLSSNLPHLIHLDLSCNHFNQEGGQAVLQGLKSNKNIKSLDVRLSGIPDEIIAEINAAILLNNDINTCFLSDQK